MKIARYRVDRKTAYGVVEGDEVVEIRGSAFASFRKTHLRTPLEGVRLLPFSDAPQIWCPGDNFPGPRAQRRGRSTHNRDDESYHPEPWQKATNALTGPGDPIIIPKDSSGDVHFEGSAVAVIGRTCRRVSPAQAQKFILGYTCGNDVSDRTWERHDRSLWRAKGSDSFAPVGPWVETGIEPQEIEIFVRVNGKRAQHIKAGDMGFSFAEIVSYISQQVTLRPGDLVFSGTAGGTSVLHPGDVVEVEIPGVGILSNPVVAEFDSSK